MILKAIEWLLLINTDLIDIRLIELWVNSVEACGTDKEIKNLKSRLEFTTLFFVYPACSP